MIRKLLAGVSLGMGAAALGLLLAWPGVLDTPELWTYDWRIRQTMLLRGVEPECVSWILVDAGPMD